MTYADLLERAYHRPKLYKNRKSQENKDSVAATFSKRTRRKVCLRIVYTLNKLGCCNLYSYDLHSKFCKIKSKPIFFYIAYNLIFAFTFISFTDIRNT